MDEKYFIPTKIAQNDIHSSLRGGAEQQRGNIQTVENKIASFLAMARNWLRLCLGG